MEVQVFFFLLYYSNPNINQVYIYVDGEEKRICMKHAAFLSLIESVLGHDIIPSIKKTLLTYGTFWLLDRTTGNINRIILKSNDNLKNIQEEVQEALKKEQQAQQGNKELQTKNIVEKYANATINISLTAEDETAPPTITVR